MYNSDFYSNEDFKKVNPVNINIPKVVEMGFTDKGLSEKPFHAFLFDPDIGMKDNAYYYDNTINFTTYNAGSQNLARDNSTIWHELGHAVMERLMGAHLGFADSKGGYGGLSEGHFMTSEVYSNKIYQVVDGCLKKIQILKKIFLIYCKILYYYGIFITNIASIIFYFINLFSVIICKRIRYNSFGFFL